MATPAVRRGDFLMTLAYATDLATGQSRDFALRSCVLATRLAEVMGLDVDMRRQVYYQALLRYIGCNADSHLLATAFGDEIALRQDLARIDMGSHSEIVEGDAVTLPVRIVTLARDAIVLNEAHGLETMAAMITKRRGGGYEEELADLFLAHAERLLEGLDGPVHRETILALEPLPHAMLDEEGCDEAYLAIADIIDMRMPFTFGHSRAVASLAEAAGKHMGLPATDIRTIRWAACTHDIGEP
jgi:hypothetical protein